MSSANPEPSSRPSAGKRIEKLLVTLLKIAIAVAGICFVLFKFGLSPPPAGTWRAHVGGLFYVQPAFHWNDTAIISAGQEIRAVTFQEDVFVFVLKRPPQDLTERPMARIRFPSSPVRMKVGDQPVEMVVMENAIVPGTRSELGVPQELDLPVQFLAESQGERIHEGIKTLLLRASDKWYLLVLAWLLLGTPFFVTAIRWRNLMRPQGIDMPLGKCLQLTFVGQFYSILLPGITGGDLVKIVYAARLVGSKTKAFITIILDRVVGLVALMVIAGTSAGIQLLLNMQAGKAVDNTLLNVFLMIVALLIMLAAGATCYFSLRMRKLVGIEWFIDNFGKLTTQAGGATGEVAQHQKLEHLFRINNGVFLVLAMVIVSVLIGLRWGLGISWAVHNTWLIYAGIGVMALVGLAAAAGLVLHEMLVNRMTPIMGRIVGGIVRLDETLHVYRGHFGLLFWAFVISLMSQLTLPLSAWLSGRAFGMTAPVAYYLAYVPIAVLAASLPISPPQGFGIMDYILFHFFVDRGTARAGQAVALAQSVRFLPILWNLMGAFWVVTGRYSRHQTEEDEKTLSTDVSSVNEPQMNTNEHE